ncbi:MAG: hypothetical protein HYV07_05195 [Deltaproteobacteria bacterium]|nr:hypothetical protein [Deltaproteobacteria bacterium]
MSDARVIAFVDLDDTLFQTRPKCPTEEPLFLAATDREGRPVSFMTGAQRRLIELLSSSAMVIPVTGRNLAAFQRVRFSFGRAAVLNHGGTILGASGEVDEEWQEHNRAEISAALPALEAAEQAVSSLSVPGLRVRRVGDHGRDIYVSVKHEHTDERMVREIFLGVRGAVEALQDLCLIGTRNNLAVLPRGVSKARAVSWLLARLRRTPESALVLGFGDALSDVEFLAQCDYAVIPRRAELFDLMLGAVER